MSPFASTHPFKQVNCRYFDQRGRPISPYCSKGDRCRFNHPNDPKWVGPVQVSNTSRFAPTRPHLENKARQMSETTANGVAPSTPLVSQSDLFQMCKVETDADNPLSWKIEELRYRQHTKRRSRSRSVASRPYDSRSYLGVEKPDDRLEDRHSKTFHMQSEFNARGENFQSNSGRNHHSRSYGRNRGTGTNTGNENQAVERNTFSASVQHAQSRPLMTSIEGIYSDRRAHEIANAAYERPAHAAKIVDLFRRLASISNDVVQGNVAQKAEETQEKAYIELSAMLSKISPSAAETVAPALAEIMSNHSKTRERVARDVDALTQVWEDVFSVFMSRISDFIDVSLKGALKTLKNDCEEAISDERNSSSFGSNGCREGILDLQPASGPNRSEFEEGESRDTKRRRLTVVTSKKNTPRPEGGNVDIDMSPSIRTILEVMKQKINTQAHSLDVLTRENSQLKNTLQHKTPFGSSRSSFSSTASSHQEMPVCSSKLSKELHSVKNIMIRSNPTIENGSAVDPVWRPPTTPKDV